MNRYADLGEGSYKFCKFNLAAKGLINVASVLSLYLIVKIA